MSSSQQDQSHPGYTFVKEEYFRLPEARPSAPSVTKSITAPRSKSASSLQEGNQSTQTPEKQADVKSDSQPQSDVPPASPTVASGVTYIHCPPEKYNIEVYAEPSLTAVVTTRLACGEDVTVLAKNQGLLGIFDRVRTTQGIEGYIFDIYIATATTTEGGAGLPSDGLGVGGGLGSGLFSTGGGVSAPTCIYCPDPSYSEEARNAKLSGTVVLQIIVDAAGEVRDARVVKPLGLGLDEKAVEAIKTWRFKPSQRNGAAVNVRMLVEVSFRLF
jgi:TonB family protein